jgi:hypothetical protein
MLNPQPLPLVTVLKEQVIQSLNPDTFEMRVCISPFSPANKTTFFIGLRLPEKLFNEINEKIDNVESSIQLSIQFQSKDFDNNFYYINFNNKKLQINQMRCVFFMCQFDQLLERDVEIYLLFNSKVKVETTAKISKTKINIACMSFRHDYKFLYPLVVNSALQSEQICDMNYISGFEKSGTTWLENIINSSPDCLVLHEASSNDVSNLFFNRPNILTVSYDKLPTIPDYKIFYRSLQDADRYDIVNFSLSRLIATQISAVFGAQLVFDRTPNAIFRITKQAYLSDGRTIFIIRNPFDSLISFIFHAINVGNRKKEYNDLLPREVYDYFIINELNAFEENSVKEFMHTMACKGAFDEYFRYWVTQQQIALKHASIYPEKILIIKYENMVNNSVYTVDCIFKFLGLLYDHRQITSLVEMNSFEKFSQGRTRGSQDNASFFRKGVIGDSDNYFSSATKIYLTSTNGLQPVIDYLA